jgi:hypothetical protein
MQAFTEGSRDIRTSISKERSKMAYEAVNWQSKYAVAQKEAEEHRDRSGFLERKMRLMEFEFENLHEEKRYLQEKEKVFLTLLHQRARLWKKAHPEEGDVEYNRSIDFEFGVADEEAALRQCARSHEYVEAITADVVTSDDELMNRCGGQAILDFDRAVMALHGLFLTEWGVFHRILTEFDAVENGNNPAKQTKQPDGNVTVLNMWRALLQMGVSIDRHALADVVKGLQDRRTMEVAYGPLQDMILREAQEAGLVPE